MRHAKDPRTHCAARDQKRLPTPGLSCPIRYREIVLMRFNVLEHLSESTEDIGVVKIMLKNSDAARISVLAREIFWGILEEVQGYTCRRESRI